MYPSLHVLHTGNCGSGGKVGDVLIGGSTVWSVALSVEVPLNKLLNPKYRKCFECSLRVWKAYLSPFTMFGCRCFDMWHVPEAKMMKDKRTKITTHWAKWREIMKMAVNVNSHQFSLCRQRLRVVVDACCMLMNFQMKIWWTVRVSPTIYLSALVHCFPSQHIDSNDESNYFHCCHLGVLKVDVMSEKLRTVHAKWFSLDNLSENDHNLKKNS